MKRLCRKIKVGERYAKDLDHAFGIWRRMMNELRDDCRRRKEGDLSISLVELARRACLLVDALSTLIRLERQIYGLGRYTPGGATH